MTVLSVALYVIACSFWQSFIHEAIHTYSTIQESILRSLYFIAVLTRSQRHHHPWVKMDSTRAQEVLCQLEERAVEREVPLSAYSSNRNCDSDEEVDASSPIFYSFLASSGAEGVVKICNFTPSEFHQLYSALSNHISDNLNNGRGKKSDFTHVDVLFMKLVVMTQGVSWDQLGSMFKIKGPKFQRFITKFLSTIQEFCVQRYVTRYSNKVTMSYCHEHKYMLKVSLCIGNRRRDFLASQQT